MNEQLRRCAFGLLALGLVTGAGMTAAGAQDIDRDRYVIQDRYVADEPIGVVADPDDDADAVAMDQDAMQRCADTFRSFDPSTGSYVTYDGETRTCPYLD